MSEGNDYNLKDTLNSIVIKMLVNTLDHSIGIKFDCELGFLDRIQERHLSQRVFNRIGCKRKTGYRINVTFPW